MTSPITPPIFFWMQFFFKSFINSPLIFSYLRFFSFEGKKKPKKNILHKIIAYQMPIQRFARNYLTFSPFFFLSFVLVCTFKLGLVSDLFLNYIVSSLVVVGGEGGGEGDGLSVAHRRTWSTCQHCYMSIECSRRRTVGATTLSVVWRKQSYRNPTTTNSRVSFILLLLMKKKTQVCGRKKKKNCCVYQGKGSEFFLFWYPKDLCCILSTGGVVRRSWKLQLTGAMPPAPPPHHTDVNFRSISSR